VHAAEKLLRRSRRSLFSRPREGAMRSASDKRRGTTPLSRSSAPMPPRAISPKESPSAYVTTWSARSYGDLRTRGTHDAQRLGHASANLVSRAPFDAPALSVRLRLYVR